MNRWLGRAAETRRWVLSRGGKASEPVAGPGADASRIEAVEKRLGRALPASLRTALLEAAALDFAWQLPDDARLPPDLSELQWGGCELALNDLPELEEGRKDWVRNCFPNPEDPYDAVWHDKLAFMTVANGDMIGFDVAQASDDPPVVYLSHEDGEGHGLRLGRSFADFMDRWSRLHFVGPEDWVWLPFQNRSLDLLDPDGGAAETWLSWVAEG